MPRTQFSVGSVEGVPFVACTSGADIIILASDFTRVQQITAPAPICSIDCSTDVGKIAAAHERQILVFGPIPLSQQQQQQANQQQQASNLSRLDYRWVQTAAIDCGSPVSVLSFCLDGSRLIAGGSELQLWTSADQVAAEPDAGQWSRAWSCTTANSVAYLKCSPDGSLFCSASSCDRLVKIWYESVTNNLSLGAGGELQSTPAHLCPPTANGQLSPAVPANTQDTQQQQRTTNTCPPPPSISTRSHRAVYDFSFIYIAHPMPVTALDWRRTSKYTPKGAVANILITSCTDNISRIWVQTGPSLHFHLAGVIEYDSSVQTNAINNSSSSTSSSTNTAPTTSTDNQQQTPNQPANTSITGKIPATSNEQPAPPPPANNLTCNTTPNYDHDSQFVVHWINNKEIHITRSIEALLHDMLTRILRGNIPTSSSTNSPHSAGESCSGSENDTKGLDDPNDDTITAESSKKLRHKLCRKMNKQRALAASGRRDLAIDSDDNGGHHHHHHQSNRNSLEPNSNGRSSPTSLVEEFDRTLESLLKKWQMSTDILFSINKNDGTLTLWQIKYLDGEDIGVFRQIQIEKLVRLKSALPHYDAITMSLNIVAYSPSSYLDVKRAYLAVTNSSGMNLNSANVNSNSSDQLSTTEVPEILSINIDSVNSITQSMKLTSSGSGDANDNISSVSLADTEPNIFVVTQHLSGILSLWKLNSDSAYPKVQSIDLVTRITGLPIDPQWLCDGTLIVEYQETTSSLVTNWIPDSLAIKDFKIEESQESIKASQLSSSISLIPQYYPKQLIELLAFGKLQRVKAILNHLVNCLVKKETDSSELPYRAHRSRTLSIVAQSSSAFSDSFDIDNPTSTIQQQVVQEIELDYIEVTSLKPLPLFSLIDADTEKLKLTDKRSSVHEEFSATYESIIKARSQVDETLDEILGETTINTLNKQKNFNRLTSQDEEEGALTSFNPHKAKSLTQVLTHTHLPGLTNAEQMHLLAIADAVALFDASPEDFNEINEGDSHDGPHTLTRIAIDSLDDRGLRFLTAMRQHIYLTRCLPMKQRNDLKTSGIGSHNIVWAFHSESQDELISLIPCIQRNKPEWAELREYGVGWWLKKLDVLRKIMEKVAQTAFQARQNPLDAALFYLAMKKKTLVCALMRRVNCDKRLIKLFEQDFNDPVNRKKALKNAYALLGLHRFEHASAFFILAGSIWDAVEVCINNLNDIQLAMVLIRLYDNHSNLSDNLSKLLSTEIVGSGAPPAHRDPFLRSMAFWKLGDYSSSIHTLLETDPSDSASVFNFYLFLKVQPLVLRHNQLELKSSPEEELKLFISTAEAYLEEGFPLLALEVLCSQEHLITSKSRRMKFIACLQIILNELNTIATGQEPFKFSLWLRKSAVALEKMCSYHGDYSDDIKFVEANEPLMRTMLTYCNLHSATANSLTTVRSELLGLLRKVK